MKLKSTASLILVSVICTATTYEALNYQAVIALQTWSEIAIVIILAIEYYALAKLASATKLKRAQIYAIIVLAFATPIFGYGLIGLQIPESSYPATYKEGVLVNGTLVTFIADMKFTTKGSFSVGNPIHAQITIHNSNPSELSNYIVSVGFTGGFYLPEQSPLKDKAVSGRFNLTKVGEGEYFVEGDFIWYQSINTHIIWLTDYTSDVNQTFWQHDGADILAISSVSDFLTVNSNHRIEQLTWVLLGFSIIAAHPILNALYPDPEIKQHPKERK